MHIKYLVVLMIGLICSFTAHADTVIDDAYKLNQGDILQISVWGEETLNKEVKVLPDGSISFPLAGRVEVANINTTEIEKRITEKLKTYLPDPQVTVVVSNIDGNKAYIIGKVNKPGPMLLSGPMTVLQALSLAGGLDKFANLSAIQILRGVGDSQEVISVHYDKLIQGKNLESNILLNTGDTILVP